MQGFLINHKEKSMNRLLHIVMILFILAGAATVRAETGAGELTTGTTFLVSHDGYLLTNYHVVEGCKSIAVYLPSIDALKIVSELFKGREIEGGVAEPVKVVKTDPQNDLALLIPESVERYRAEKIQAGAKPYDCNPYELQPCGDLPFFSDAAVFRGDNHPIALGESVTVVGFPLRGLLTGINVTTGIVSALAGVGRDMRLIQISAPVQAGNSGGPLLDNQGNVIGVIVSKLDAVKTFELSGDVPQNVNFAIRGEVAREFLRSSISISPFSPNPAKDTSAIAALAKNLTFPVECQK
jgi:S1-C subfamily serine protease